MALFDWNGNGKDDIFDNLIDYKIATNDFDRDETSDDIDDEAELDEFDQEDEEEDNE